MIDARTEELINAALDDELGAGERGELEQRLAGSSEAREYQASLQQLDNHLRAMPQEALPASLHEQITTAVELPAPVSRKAGIADVRAWPGVVRYGLADPWVWQWPSVFMKASPA